MLKIIEGDIFESGADAILHQVNCQGVMGSGVAKQVRDRYPWVFAMYRDMCFPYKMLDGKTSGLLGLVLPVYINETQRIYNLFAQDRYGYDGKCYTNYDSLRECLKAVNIVCREKTVAIPYLMGCHRGGGDWEIVSKMIEETLTDCDVTLYKYTK